MRKSIFVAMQLPKPVGSHVFMYLSYINRESFVKCVVNYRLHTSLSTENIFCWNVEKLHIQYRWYNERAFAFACNRVRFRVRTRSPPSLNAFASPHKRVRLHPRTERKRTRLFRRRLTLLVRACSTLISRSTVPLYIPVYVS